MNEFMAWAYKCVKCGALYSKKLLFCPGCKASSGANQPINSENNKKSTNGEGTDGVEH